MALSIFITHATDRQTDTSNLQRPSLCIGENAIMCLSYSRTAYYIRKQEIYNEDGIRITIKRSFQVVFYKNAINKDYR